MILLAPQTPSEIETVRGLFREYESVLGENLCFQGFESELAGLPGRYGPPDGALLLATEAGMATGCAALRRLGPVEDRTCEMKRLFVKPAARGRGIGRKLAESIVRKAIRLGYRTMFLDTLERLKPALALYESMGFVRTEPYYENPLPGVLYWKLELIGRNRRKDAPAL